MVGDQVGFTISNLVTYTWELYVLLNVWNCSEDTVVSTQYKYS